MVHRFRYRIVDVFSAGRSFTGNPLCVFEDARGLTAVQQQALARQFNLSETTFILPSRRATARVRIFTPAYEMPFAGHPTLGTAAVVSSLHRGTTPVFLELAAGIVPVRLLARGTGRWEFRAPELSWRSPGPVPVEEIFHLPARSVLPGTCLVKAGYEQLIVPLASPADVRAARADVAKLTSLQPPGAVQVYLFAEAGPGKVEARFFFAQDALVGEDPGTGSACANLGGWYVSRGATLPLRRTVSQGSAIARPSRLFLRVEADRSIHVAGEVREVGRGSVVL